MTPIKEAQRAYDAMEPAEYFGCEENDHDWRFTGRASDGTTFYRCPKCGAEVDQ